MAAGQARASAREGLARVPRFFPFQVCRAGEGRGLEGAVISIPLQMRGAPIPQKTSVVKTTASG